MSDSSSVSGSRQDMSDCEPGGGCPEAEHRLDLYLDGELTEVEIHEVSVHLAACYPCGSRVEFERHLRAVIKNHATEVAPSDLIEKVRSRYREAARGD
jgi:anti-sigma factor (TIGR02949 family)